MNKKMCFFSVALLIACFSLVNFSHADPLVYFYTDNPIVAPGQTISVGIFSSESSGWIRMDRIADNNLGTADNLWLHPGYDGLNISGNAVNSDGLLIEGVEGYLGTPGSPSVPPGLIYTFDYTVSINVQHEEVITIFADPTDGAENWVDVIGMLEDLTPEPLYLTVWIPEPTTVSLLLLGGIIVSTRLPVLRWFHYEMNLFRKFYFSKLLQAIKQTVILKADFFPEFAGLIKQQTRYDLITQKDPA